MDKVKLLQGYYFYANSLGNKYGYDRAEDFDGAIPKRVGIIAQELMAVAPELITIQDHIYAVDGIEYYYVEYEKLNALLLQAIKELDARAEVAKTAAGL
jgi:hypothetical protein